MKREHNESGGSILDSGVSVDQLIDDLQGLERLQSLQLDLVRNLRRELERQKQVAATGAAKRRRKPSRERG